MSIQPRAVSGSLTDAAYETIKRLIRTCALAPGSRITEKQLAEDLGYGKTPVREALARLVNENFVRVIPRSGYEVTPLTLRDFQDIFELSRIVWPAMMALAAERSPDNFPTSRSLREGAETGNWIEDGRSWLAAAANATGNQRLAETCMHLYDEMERFFSLMIRHHGVPLSLTEMEEQISTAFSRRDTAELKRLVCMLIDRMEEEFLAVLHKLPSILDTPLP
ncbi:MAG TPA: GntR family transcriptional regulator [Ktedonobacteraceae bacterium]|nr:GntR family transcriptional regulator [Ktedonobacteraceae bacterium]